MRKLILGAGAALAVAAGQAAGQGLPTQSPAPVVPIGQSGPTAAVAAPATGANCAPVVPLDGGSYTGVITGGPAGPGGRGYVEASFLLMWLNGGNSTVPLLTTGPSLGIIGRPGTAVIVDKTGSDYDIIPGTRVAVGGFFGDSRAGFELNGLYLGKTTQGDSFGPTSATVLARPFIDPTTGRENARIIASPGAFTGGFATDQSAQIWGFETNPFWRVANGSPFTMDLITGFRFFRTTETLNIYDSSSLLAGGVSAFNGLGVASPSGIVVHDRFHTQNTFYGGQIGAKVGFGGGERGWFVDLLGKVAIGGVHQKLSVDGSTTLTGGGLVNTATTPGGFLATGPNLGDRSEDRFAVLPEGGITVGYQFSPAFNVFFGYSVMYLSSAARPGDQVSRTVAPTQLPSSPSYNNKPIGGFTGIGTITDSDLWLHGFSFGATFSY